MTDEEARTWTRKPGCFIVPKVSSTSPLTGVLRDNGDGTYSIDSGLGSFENPAYVHRFTAAEIGSVNPL